MRCGGDTGPGSCSGSECDHVYVTAIDTHPVIYEKLLDSVLGEGSEMRTRRHQGGSMSQKAIAMIGLIIAAASLALQWQQLQLTRQQQPG